VFNRFRIYRETLSYAVPRFLRYLVLVTLDCAYEIFALAGSIDDRADAENNFDELKNQWG
jgi:hypothetical protein